MKIRSGFVSNSSSSSFCVHGTSIKADEIMDLINAVDKSFEGISEVTELVAECRKAYEDGSMFETEYLDRLLGKVFAKTEISHIISWECETVCIGRGYKTLKDDETGAQFKKSAEDEIKKYLPYTTLEFINEEIST